MCLARLNEFLQCHTYIVYNGDPLDPAHLHRVHGRESHVVEETEPAPAVALGMVAGGPDEAVRVADRPVEDSIHRVYAPARCRWSCPLLWWWWLCVLRWVCMVTPECVSDVHACAGMPFGRGLITRSLG